jgi:hypothetical protein
MPAKFLYFSEFAFTTGRVPGRTGHEAQHGD